MYNIPRKSDLDKIKATERKLEATEELLAIARQELAEMTRRREDKDKSHKLQARNTGVFWEQARAAERKLKAIEEVLDQHGGRIGSIQMAVEIREVLDGGGA